MKWRKFARSALAALVAFACSAALAANLGGFTSTPSNLYDLGYNPSAQAWYTDTSGKTSVSCSITGGQSTLVLLVVSQSIPANSAPTAYTPSNATAHALSVIDGNCYRATDPLLGGTGQPPSGATFGGSYVSKLADKIITDGKYQRVIVVVSSIGGTSAADWAPTGPWNAHLRTALLRIRQKAYVGNADVTYRVLYDQGTTDAVNGTSQANWQASFQQIVGTINGFGLGAPKICVSIDTMATNATNATIQAAQQAVVDNVQIFQAGNLDTLTGGNRQADGTHLSDTGTTNAAALNEPCVAP
ncbi:MAG: sialate O-acetylesterase [bacterium]|nr:sialate O-acetylesterase [bacterium]